MGLVDVAKVTKLGTLERKLQPERKIHPELRVPCWDGEGNAERQQESSGEWRVRIVG